MSNSNPKGVNNTARRTFDQAAYLQKAKDREEKEKDFEYKRKGEDEVVNLSEMKPAKARETPVLDYSTIIGRKEAVASADQATGFTCTICDVVMKDSQSYLDHINGKKHLRAVGTSLAPERATLDQVKERLRMHKMKNVPLDKIKEDLEQKMERMRKEEEEKKNSKKKKKKEVIQQKLEQKQKEIEAEADPELSAFGLPIGFGSSKK